VTVANWRLRLAQWGWGPRRAIEVSISLGEPSGLLPGDENRLTENPLRCTIPQLWKENVNLHSYLAAGCIFLFFSAVRQDFTTDKSAAKRSVLRIRAQGNTALFDALSQAAQDLSARPGKKALVVFTDGEDNASVLSATSAVVLAKKVGVRLYAIAEGDAAHSKNLTALLTDLSVRTGGSAYEVKKSDDIEHVFESISQDLEHLYLISYQPPSTQADEKWRKIDVVVKGVNEARIRAKQGYFPN
jgi:VWFA-related protein